MVIHCPHKTLISKVVLLTVAVPQGYGDPGVTPNVGAPRVTPNISAFPDGYLQLLSWN